MSTVTELPSAAPEARPITGGRAKRRLERSQREVFFIAVDEDHLLELATITATMPWCASGQIFIEVSDKAAISDLVVPDRISVRWLVRSERSGAPGTGARCGKGEALIRATRAWASEMCPEPGAEEALQNVKAYLLTDYIRSADLLDELSGSVGLKPEQVFTDVKFALATARW